jgi:hypothetical protein
MIMREPVLTEADMTPAERAAWEVAVNRGLNISRLDVRLLLLAASGVMAGRKT